MSIVLELQREAIDSEVPVTDLLRKALVVSKKLSIKEFEEWVQLELAGYDVGDVFPEYRKTKGTVKLKEPHWGWQRVYFDTSEKEEMASIRPTGQSIAEIEKLLSTVGRNDAIQMPFTSKFINMITKNVGVKGEVTLFVETTELTKVIDTVRNIILKWSLKLEEDGILGGDITFSQEEREKANTITYNVNNFYGDVQGSQIQQHTTGSQQTSTINELDNIIDFINALQEKIVKLNLTPDEEKELSAEISTIKAQAESPKPKGTIIKESLGSIRRMLENASGGMASQLLLQYGPALSELMSKM